MAKNKQVVREDFKSDFEFYSSNFGEDEIMYKFKIDKRLGAAHLGFLYNKVGTKYDEYASVWCTGSADMVLIKKTIVNKEITTKINFDNLFKL